MKSHSDNNFKKIHYSIISSSCNNFLTNIGIFNTHMLYLLCIYIYFYLTCPCSRRCLRLPWLGLSATLTSRSQLPIWLASSQPRRSDRVDTTCNQKEKATDYKTWKVGCIVRDSDEC